MLIGSLPTQFSSILHVAHEPLKTCERKGEPTEEATKAQRLKATTATSLTSSTMALSCYTFLIVLQGPRYLQLRSSGPLPPPPEGRGEPGLRSCIRDERTSAGNKNSQTLFACPSLIRLAPSSLASNSSEGVFTCRFIKKSQCWQEVSAAWKPCRLATRCDSPASVLGFTSS